MSSKRPWRCCLISSEFHHPGKIGDFGKSCLALVVSSSERLFRVDER